MITPPPVVDPNARERQVLEAGMIECRRRLQYARDEHDDLAIDLLESDLNLMLERWDALHRKATT